MRPIAVLSLAASLAAGFAVSALPARAQEVAAPAGEKVNTLIIYGNDPCPESKEDEITVCARKSEEERFRIPAPLRETPSSKSESWSQRVLAYETVGATGINSCSPVGPGGVNGCTQKLIDAAYAEKKAGTDVQFARMLAEERAKRAATVDASAAATQARVEQAEKAYDARLRAEAEAAENAAAGTAAPARPAPKP